MALLCRIVHATLGRARLRVPSLQHDVSLGQQLEVYLRDQAGIEAVRSNAVCASVVVTFDPERCPPQALCRTIASLSLETLKHYPDFSVP